MIFKLAKNKKKQYLILSQVHLKISKNHSTHQSTENRITCWKKAKEEMKAQ